MRNRSFRASVLARALVLWSSAAAAAYAGTSPAGQVHGTLTEVDGVRILRIWGTSTERGYAHGYLLATDIAALLDGYLSRGALGGGVLAYRTVTLPMTRSMQISPAYEAELRGMFAGIESRNGGPANVPSLGRTLEYDDLVAINCIPDMALFGCSSFAVWKSMTRDGGTLAGRNLDWRRLDALDGSQIVVVHVPQPEHEHLGWVSITWPGYIGCLTGMNAEGVTVSMHDVRMGPPAVTTGFTPRGLSLRDAIESAHAASAVKDIARVLRARVSVVGNNVHVTKPCTGESAGSVVFEYDGTLPRTGGVTVRAPNEGSYQLCTNHYVKRAEPIACDRYQTIHARLVALAAHQETLDVDGAWEILRSVVRPSGIATHLLTYQSVVFEPNRHRMHVAFSRDGKPAPQCKAVTVNVLGLLAGKRAGGATE